MEKNIEFTKRAFKAWETRRANQLKKKLSDRAKKAWATRKQAI